MPVNSASPPEEPEPGSQPAIGSAKPAAEPRLSIVHLMVATVCVALYAAVARVYIAARPDSGDAYQAILAGMGSVGGGLALAGLLLVPARRRRGLRFPRHPGEYLVFLLGVDVVLVLLSWSILLLTDALHSQPWETIVALYLVRAITLAGFYVYCIVGGQGAPMAGVLSLRVGGVGFLVWHAFLRVAFADVFPTPPLRT